MKTMATITVTNENDSGAGSLRAALAAAAPGDIINFGTDVTTINLDSSLVISKGITVDGLQPGSTNPGVTINGGGAGSNFSDFVIDAGVTATFDGLIIQDGHATGAVGANTPLSNLSQPGGQGSAAAGGIYDAGALTLNNSVLQADTATGGFGGRGAAYGGGGGGGSAAGAIYVGATGSLDLNSSDSFINDSAAGGVGGGGGGAVGYTSGIGGAGGVTGVDAGSGAPGTTGSGSFAGAGGAPGQPGASGRYIAGPGGGGGGGNAFVVGGKGSIAGAVTLVVTNNSDNATTAGSLRFELSIAHAGDTILFDPSVTMIDLSSSLVIAANLTIDGLQPGTTTPGVTINGGGNSSNFADFTVNAGVSATIDGVIIQDGHATGATGANGAAGYDAGGNGGAAAGGIYDAGALTLDNSVLQADTATGGSGGYGGPYGGGGGGGSAAGAIYVTKSGSLDLASSDTFISDSAVGGAGGKGGNAVGAFALFYASGAGGAGGVTGFNTGYGAPGAAATGAYGGRGGALGQPGSPSRLYDLGAGGGGGGGSAFIVGGAGTISAGFDVLPVCIKAGALGTNMPVRDLWISPHHAMYFSDQGGVLIEAKDLVNGISIVQAERVDKVEYVHVELETHDVIIAEGALSETYLDEDNRGMFHNALDYDTLSTGDDAQLPTRYCAPRLEDGYAVEHVRRRIAARARSRSFAGSHPHDVKVYRRAARR
jgi:collagen type I/II/III/V/XI/XXIV/XXVII alpha